MSLRLAVIDYRPLAERERVPLPFHVLFKPKFTTGSEDTVASYEGCLSLAGFSALVPPRPPSALLPE
jgi:peptide deformylase